MSDWRDVMHARDRADEIASSAEMLQDSFQVHAVVRALLAVKEELRALGTTIDYALGMHE